MDEDMNFSQICRGCLSDRKESLRCIVKSNMLDIFINCTNLKVDKNDGLPMNICSTCVYKCISWHSFKQQCEQSDFMLRNHLSFGKNIQNQLLGTNNDKEEDLIESIQNLDSDEKIKQTVLTNDGCEIVEDHNDFPIIPIENEANKSPDDIEQYNDDDSIEIYIEEPDEDEGHKVQEEYSNTNEGKQLEEQLKLNAKIGINEKPNENYTHEDKLVNKIQIDETKKDAEMLDNVASEPEVNNKFSKKKAIFSCTKCNETFRNDDRLQAHVRVHLGQKPEVCKVCQKQFNNLRALRRHKISHIESKGYSCQECGKLYKYQTSLALHKKVHQNIGRFVCDICGRSFVRLHGLQSHALTHTTDTPFSCDTCGKSFKNLVMLRNHQRRHDGIKTFICAECGKDFHTSAELTTHSRMHTGEKPFNCSMCEKSYKSQSHLAVHFRSHTGDRKYLCDLCPMKFAYNKVLRQHRLIHTGERPFICEVCQRPFRQKTSLTVHMRRHIGVAAKDACQK